MHQNNCRGAREGVKGGGGEGGSGRGGEGGMPGPGGLLSARQGLFASWS